MEAATKFTNQDKWDNEQNSFSDHIEKQADDQHKAQRAQGEKKAIYSVLIEFHVTSRNGPCLQEPFCSDGGNPLDHLILLNRRRDSGALGWWMIPDDAVLAPTKSTADRKKAVNPASREARVLIVVI